MDLFINNRRYIGSKKSLLHEIQTVIHKYQGPQPCKIADVFAGTGVVAEHLAKQGYDIIVNDLLFSNYVAYNTWLSDGEISIKKVEEYIKSYNDVNGENLERNYFSDAYGDKYFSINDSKKIGYLRDKLESDRPNLTDREYYAILTSLIYATDKIANTVGHFEHYLSKEPKDKGVTLKLPFITEGKNSERRIFNMDANDLIKEIEADVLYIDPPYNSRQYINFYHVLENLALWRKPTELMGKSRKFSRDSLKSGYSQAKAPELMKDLIDNAKAKLIIVSYNNTYTAKSNASNNKISEQQLKDILSEKGDVEVFDIDHKSFNSGKTDFSDHKEKLYVCKVK